MRILRIILIIVAASLFVSAQTLEKPKAYKFFEYKKISSRLLKAKLLDFKAEVEKLSNGTGVIINYGTPYEIAVSEKQLRNNLFRCGYDGCSRFSFINGGRNKKRKTEMWIIPEGAEEPIPTPEKETK